MALYQPRPSRFDLNLPLSFLTEDESLDGHCVNVSESGMLANFPKPVELFTRGTVWLLVGEFYVDIKARVARTQGLDAGLAFITETENDRVVTKLLVEYAVSQNQPDGPSDSA